MEITLKLKAGVSDKMLKLSDDLKKKLDTLQSQALKVDKQLDDEIFQAYEELRKAEITWQSNSITKELGVNLQSLRQIKMNKKTHGDNVKKGLIDGLMSLNSSIIQTAFYAVEDEWKKLFSSKTIPMLNEQELTHFPNKIQTNAFSIHRQLNILNDYKVKIRDMECDSLSEIFKALEDIENQVNSFDPNFKEEFILRSNSEYRDLVELRSKPSIIISQPQKVEYDMAAMEKMLKDAGEFLDNQKVLKRLQ